MTTVIGVETLHRTTIATDSQISSGYSKRDGFVKVVQNGDYTFAAAGYARAIQILQFASLPPVPASVPQIQYTQFEHPQLDRFFTLEIIPAIREAFETSDNDALEESEVIVAVKNRLYGVSGGCGAWTRSLSGFYAAGSGEEYALGALEAGATPALAVQIAGQYDMGTNADVREITISAV